MTVSESHSGLPNAQTTNPGINTKALPLTDIGVRRTLPKAINALDTRSVRLAQSLLTRREAPQPCLREIITQYLLVRLVSEFASEMAGFEYACRSLGIDCPFEVKGASTRDELMNVIGTHAKLTHNMDPIPADVAQKVSAAIKG